MAAKNILITGAAGFIGQLLAARLLSSPKYHLTLTDIITPTVPANVKYPQNAKCIQADLSSADSLQQIFTPPPDAAFIFHGIMSSGAEANFDLGMHVNFDSTRALLEYIRHNHAGLRIIYASSQAVYGQPLPATVTENYPPTPEGSYGAEKLLCEVLINEYTRRGWLAGFTLRFPTISVRPGRPTAAASSFLSGMVREPLAGQTCVIPLRDRSFASWLCSPRTLVHNLELSLGVPTDALPSHFRVVNMPGIRVTVQEMLDAVERVGGRECLDLIREEPDEGLERILRSWPTNFDNKLAYSLGFVADGSFEQAVRDFQASL
jgi:nucleoside-diphosphate-sugar epimerase